MIGHPDDCMCQECASETRDPDIVVRDGKQYDPGMNIFTQDHFHMGTRMGSNVMILHPNHSEEVCNYFIVVDLMTGKSKRISFTDKGLLPSMSEQIINGE